VDGARTSAAQDARMAEARAEEAARRAIERTMEMTAEAGALRGKYPEPETINYKL